MPVPVMRALGILLLTLAAGCAGVAETPSGVMAQAESRAVEPVAGEWNAEDAVPAPRPPPETKEEAKAASLPAEPRRAATVIPPSAGAHAKAPAARVPEPPLDVAALKARLRDTNAIGVFTKLALKNQVDDLLKAFRAHYLNGQKTSVASLRQPYDMLVLKVLALVQDSDPPLARTISGSREAIWNILADPEQFKLVS